MPLYQLKQYYSNHSRPIWLYKSDTTQKCFAAGLQQQYFKMTYISISKFITIWKYT